VTNRDDVLKDLRYVPGPVPTAYESDHLERELVEISDVLRRIQDPGWDDLRTPASVVNLHGAITDPTRDSATGLLLFEPTKTNLVLVFDQMPHAWMESTSIYPHVHWQKTTSAAGNVAWRCRYKKAPIAAVMDAAWTDMGIVTTPVAGTPDINTADYQLITAFGAVNMDDMNISDSILFELSRVGTDAGDTYGADARLLEFDAHYQSNRWGSIEEFAH